ncbi:Glutamate-cysteine ligase family 2(GCS2) [Legionella wadsworthii]|uniref:Glutamate-cysteine ligase family 2(GCS2) n=1 Tax=Legionella wadsworthii TaxID=28088 RepID=A0A378LTZ6_9GAMM|nr:glutamate-cysteine ligase family protein [Legionella wadsworthii]STY29299.1 Glutamate-cysteine ligase family 2(GCS2) [Legionella wadsworthii]
MHIKEFEKYTIDCELFEKYLIAETQLLKEWFHKKYFKSQNMKAGAEIEFLILDENYQLSPHNLFFTQKLENQKLVREAGTAQLEINTPVFSLEDNFLSSLHQSISTIWNNCCEIARQSQHHLALIGSMPQNDHSCFKLFYITPKNIFMLMNELVGKYRKNLPLCVHINGKGEDLVLFPESLAMEGLICSFQLHLEVPFNQILEYYNLVQILSAPLLALSSNSPYFCGKHVWSETRIGIFEQLYSFPAPFQKTVFFEPDYLQNSLFPMFEKNINFPHLLPLAAQEEPVDTMFHVRCQNSCVFRWNRPILAFNEDNEPYLRIEHRVLSTGPTVVDMIANAAFFYGITYYFANKSPSLTHSIPREFLIKNFYAAAHDGLNANLKWINGHIKALDLLKSFIPLAFRGLEIMGINTMDANFYLNIIKQRLDKNQNGSIWQEKFLSKHANDFNGLLEQYIVNQYSETPVSDWSL